MDNPVGVHVGEWNREVFELWATVTEFLGLLYRHSEALTGAETQVSGPAGLLQATLITVTLAFATFVVLYSSAVGLACFVHATLVTARAWLISTIKTVVELPIHVAAVLALGSLALAEKTKRGACNLARKCAAFVQSVLTSIQVKFEHQDQPFNDLMVNFPMVLVDGSTTIDDEHELEIKYPEAIFPMSWWKQSFFAASFRGPVFRLLPRPPAGQDDVSLVVRLLRFLSVLLVHRDQAHFFSGEPPAPLVFTVQERAAFASAHQMATGIFGACHLRIKVRRGLAKLADPVEAANFLAPGITVQASQANILSSRSKKARGNTWSVSVTNRMLVNGIEA